MMDSIGSRSGLGAVTSQDRTAPVAPARETRKAADSPDEAPNRAPTKAASRQLELSALALEAGRPSPMDEKRVEEVKRAVRNGTYPIAPETIADRMLALKLYWSPAK